MLKNISPRLGKKVLITGVLLHAFLLLTLGRLVPSLEFILCTWLLITTVYFASLYCVRFTKAKILVCVLLHAPYVMMMVGYTVEIISRAGRHHM